jgi:hypothetical protein
MLKLVISMNNEEEKTFIIKPCSKRGYNPFCWNKYLYIIW